MIISSLQVLFQRGGNGNKRIVVVFATDGTRHMLGALYFTRAGSTTPEGTLMISEAAAYTQINLDDIVKGLSFEEISPEPMSMITKDINLPKSAGEENVSISWESSDESVITNEGKVTRDPYEAKNVTLTIKGTDVVKYDLTVLPEEYNVYKTQNFYYPNDDKANPALSGSFINASKGKSLSVDDDGNYYITFDFGADGVGYGMSASTTLYDSNNRYQTVYLYANMKTSGEFKNGIDLRTTIRNSAKFTDLGKNITIARIKDSNIYTNTGNRFAGTLKSDGFTPVIFKVDLLTSTVEIKVGDGEWVEGYSFEKDYIYPTDGTKNMLGALNFARAAGSSPEGVIEFSEIAAYTIK